MIELFKADIIEHGLLTDIIEVASVGKPNGIIALGCTYGSYRG